MCVAKHLIITSESLLRRNFDAPPLGSPLTTGQGKASRANRIRRQLPFRAQSGEKLTADD